VNAMKSATAPDQSNEILDPPDAGDASSDAAAATSDDVIATTINDSSVEADSAAGEPASGDAGGTRRNFWTRLVAFGLLPIVALLFAVGAGYLKYRDASLRNADAARVQSVQAASEGAVALLSYGPDDVEAKLTAAQDRLTGSFRDSYSSLIKTVVIPGAKQQRISATATVPAAASISATGTHAEVMVFVNQAIIMGNDAPTDTASAVDVALDKVGDRWLISGFDPK
jgi:Mce-associated membrane protein